MAYNQHNNRVSQQYVKENQKRISLRYKNDTSFSEVFFYFCHCNLQCFQFLAVRFHEFYCYLLVLYSVYKVMNKIWNTKLFQWLLNVFFCMYVHMITMLILVRKKKYWKRMPFQYFHVYGLFNCSYFLNSGMVRYHLLCLSFFF